MPVPNREEQPIQRNARPAREETEAHSVTVTNRCNVIVTGVKDVSSFDETGVVMETVRGALTLDGESFNITKLDLDAGEVVVCGKLIGMYYIDPSKSKKRFFGRG